MKKKLVLKDSVKSFLIVSSLFVVVIVGSIAIGKRNQYLEQQKMTDTSQTYISQK